MRTRLEHIRVLFVIGCNEMIPQAQTEAAFQIMTEILKGAGMELALAAREEVFCQQYYLYSLNKAVSKALCQL